MSQVGKDLLGELFPKSTIQSPIKNSEVLPLRYNFIIIFWRLFFWLKELRAGKYEYEKYCRHMNVVLNL